jgi:hypothetical protein
VTGGAQMMLEHLFDPGRVNSVVGSAAQTLTAAR